MGLGAVLKSTILRKRAKGGATLIDETSFCCVDFVPEKKDKLVLQN